MKRANFLKPLASPEVKLRTVPIGHHISVDTMEVINHQFVHKLDLREKKWLSHAIVGIIGADGKVDEAEVAYLREAIDFLDSREEIDNLMEAVKTHHPPPLPILRVPRKTAFDLLSYLALIAISDGKLSNSEVQYFRFAGSRLGVDARFAQQLTKWIHDLLTLNKQREVLHKTLEQLPPTYKWTAG